MVSYLSPRDWDTHMWPAVPLCLLVWCRSCSWWTAVFATKPFLKAAHCVKPSDVSVPHPPWVFIVPLLASDHLIPHPETFSHADQDIDVVRILMSNWKDEGKLQTAVYTTRNFLFQLEKSSCNELFEPGSLVYHLKGTVLCFCSSIYIRMPNRHVSGI